jgi:hypothetical protein
MVTVPSVFYLEKKNSLFFVLIRTNGRLKFLCSKLILIFLIDFTAIIIFTMLYGLRFAEANYFLILVPRWGFIALLLITSSLILSLSFTYKPWIAWLLMFLLIFGGILNKSALFPVNSIVESYKFLTFLLPPFLELIYSAITLDFPFWRIIFLIAGFIQIILYFLLNYRFIQKKDFV